MLQFEVQNGRTYIVGADSYILDRIDQVIRYPVQDEDTEYYTDGDIETAWDGWIRFLHRPKTMYPWFPTGLLAYVIPAIQGMDYQILDRRLVPPEEIPYFIDTNLRPYQKEAVSKALRMGRGVFDMVPRSGKTRCGIDLYQRLALPTIWVAPTSPIVRQTAEVINSFFGNEHAEVVKGVGKIKDVMDVPLVVTTAATAKDLPKSFYQTRQCIIIDEFHHSSSRSYAKIFGNCDHIFYRYGMTGTFFRSYGDDMAMHAHLSNVIYRVDSFKLLELGFLVPTKVLFIPVNAPKVNCNGESAFNKGHGKFGIHQHLLRNQMVARCTQFLNSTGRTVLILVGTKVQGRILRDMLVSYFSKVPVTEFRPVQFVSSDTPKIEFEKVKESFINRGEVQVLIGTSVIGEGVDLPTADALVYACGQKARVQVVQNAYRVGTMSPGKSHAVLVDFVDRHHRKLMEHTEERAKIYCNEPTFEVDVVDGMQDFESRFVNFPVSNV